MPVKVSKHHVVRAVSVILRVPALFIAEAWYRTDPKSIQSHYHAWSEPRTDRHEELLFQLAYYTVLLLAISLIVLPLRKLVTLYMYLVSALLLMAAHHLSQYYIDNEQGNNRELLFEDSSAVWRLGMHLAVQGLISATIAYLINLDRWQKWALLIYTAPMFARMCSYPVDELHRFHNLAFMVTLLLIIFYLFNRVPQVLDLVKAGVQKVSLAVQLYGWMPFLLAMWFKILLPVQLLIFWLLLFTLQLYKYWAVAAHPIFNEGWVVVLLATIGECCVTPISLMGVCVTVSYVSYIILAATKLYLQGREAFLHDNVMQQGWTEGFTMFLLSVQTGLIELKAAQRAFLMSIVLFIVLSSLIQSVYEITDPVLLVLGASQNKSVMKHCRAIVLCTFLWLFPLYMTYTIFQFFDLDFWLLVVISSCVLTSVQVIGSIVVYTLFMYDAVRTTPWDSLDDVVYYAKATTRVLEFIVAVLVVCYGVQESLFGEWSWINTSILIIHCYFNVWQRLQAGWKSYLLRREAVKKIEAMPLATEEQLLKLNDVCAICFQQLKTARVTPCQHFFHGICLRKWLYVQENCPMCHQAVTKSTPNDSEEADEDQEHVELNNMAGPQIPGDNTRELGALEDSTEGPNSPGANDLEPQDSVTATQGPDVGILPQPQKSNTASSSACAQHSA